ncbi:caffeoylshikimate esterase-like [Cucurbita pepo subsp. pepo]|uniref:caffeoylshikimate esterase-like n=1 Tax=Cucurbita pepo subsp. pepo TaxID=3664 RepID=UPI000C9D3B81|nr:caffeoylshikimate esterase-like [Cucurbita pepo subsp. pepo]
MSQTHHQNPQSFLNYWGNISEEDYYASQRIKSSKSFYTSPRGLKLFTRSWLPLPPTPPRALIFMVHGYGNNISWTFQATAIFLAQMGFACFALDLEGHGGSEGLKAFVPNVDSVVHDCLSFFRFVKLNPQFQGLPAFLFGESMGGAICLLIHFADPKGFEGAILVAPMCKISDKVKPIWPIPQFLTAVARFLPSLAIVPTADLLEKSVKVEEKKIVAEMNPMRYRGKPRLGTVVELLRVTEDLSGRLGDVKLPFIVVHGDADVVTDPNVSKSLYEEAQSEDKTMKIYEGMMHSMLFGETDENVEIVRNDIVSWLNARCRSRISDDDDDDQKN